MSFRDIKIRVAQYTGLDDSDTNDLALIKQLVNEAAKEVYNSGDLPGSLDEAVFTLDQNYQIALPYLASNIRGLRQYQSQARLALANMSERYQNNPWYRDWERFRIKQDVPIQYDIINAGTLTITAGAADGGTLVITGSTLSSNRISETVLMDASVKTTTNQFTAIHSITSPARRTYDYNVLDVDSRVLAVLANNSLKTNYQILLLSNYPWASVSETQTIEILFKKAFYPFSEDGDEFVASDFDAAIYYKFQSNWDATRKGDEERSLLADKKSAQVRDGEVANRVARQPDSRIVFKPTAGQRVQRSLKYYNTGPKDYFRP